MDQILRSLLDSNKKDSQKQVVVKQICSAGEQSNSVESITAIFQTTMAIMLGKNDALAVKAAQEILISWAKSNRATLAQYLTMEVAAQLMEEKHKNPETVSFILLNSFRLLAESYPDRLSHLEHVVEYRAVHFVERNQTFSALSPFCHLLLKFNRCIPQDRETANFCCAVLHAATYFDLPPGVNPQFYINRVNTHIGGLLQHIWSRSDSNTIMRSLKTVFDIIQTVTEEGIERAPSHALAGLVQFIPTGYIETATKSVIYDNSIPDSNMELALGRMIQWLHWPLSAKTIDLWILQFLRGLAATHKYTILINVTEQQIERVTQCLFFPVARICAFEVFNHMLLSFQHSSEAFHKIVERMPALVSQLQKEVNDVSKSVESRDRSRDYLLRLNDLLHSLMQLHPGFPDLYEPILEQIKSLPRPSPEGVQQKLTESKWGSQQTQQQGNQRMMSIAKSLRKSETGKIGLLNLGNTCYMNSVLQALFMCDSFRQDLLSSIPSSPQLLLVKLQYAFAFLSASNRAFYAPKAFLSASRPPWFTKGHQQDCSEFLKYLLDQLHEQDIQKQRLNRVSAIEAEQETGSSPSPKKEKKSGLFSSSKQGRESPKGESNQPLFIEEPLPSLVQRTFGGKVVNTYTCFKCRNQSSRNESFTDIPLAFPENFIGNKGGVRKSGRKAATLAGGSSSKNASKKAAANGAEVNINQNNGESNSKSGELLLQELLADYLKPEKLEGDNKYHCDNCKSLQEAERTVHITQSPEYLILTLLRFAYDVKTHSRSKIFTDVRYPKTLYVPVTEVMPSAECDSPPKTSPVGPIQEETRPQSPKSGVSKKSRKKGPAASTSVSQVAENLDIYALSAVVVHSGLTIDGGHYYTYARHSIVVNEAAGNGRRTGGDREELGDIDYLQDKWYLFNDSRVTYSGYSSFSDITQKFAKDTAYVLIYKKIKAGDIQTIDANASIMTAVIDPPLRRDLRETVDKDNKLYIQEQEYEERRRLNAKKREESATWFWKDHDDQGGPPGSCGGGGGFGMHQGPSFVF